MMCKKRITDSLRKKLLPKIDLTTNQPLKTVCIKFFSL